MNARKLTDIDRAEIAALKARGKTSAAIGIMFGISSDAARRIAKRALAKTGVVSGDAQRCAPTPERPAAGGYALLRCGFEVAR